MRLKWFFVIAGLGLVFGPLAGLGQLRGQPGQGGAQSPEQAEMNKRRRMMRHQQRMQHAANPVASPGADGGAGADPDAKAREAFGHLDANADGLLSYDEMDDGLKSERAKWDANGDGFIDFNEYKEYFKARMQHDAPAGGGPAAGTPDDAGAGLPGWFRQYDTDGDGQVGLYEWRAARQPIARFLAMDLNGDGFLTPDEVLWATAHGGQ